MGVCVAGHTGCTRNRTGAPHSNAGTDTTDRSGTYDHTYAGSDYGTTNSDVGPDADAGSHGDADTNTNTGANTNTGPTDSDSASPFPDRPSSGES